MSIILRCVSFVFDCREKSEENLNFFVIVYLCMWQDDQYHLNVFPDRQHDPCNGKIKTIFNKMR